MSASFPAVSVTLWHISLSWLLAADLETDHWNTYSSLRVPRKTVGDQMWTVCDCDFLFLLHSDRLVFGVSLHTSWLCGSHFHYCTVAQALLPSSRCRSVRWQPCEVRLTAMRQWGVVGVLWVFNRLPDVAATAADRASPGTWFLKLPKLNIDLRFS